MGIKIAESVTWGKNGKHLEPHSRTFSVLHTTKQKFKILTSSRDLSLDL
jgi:hypothetical protein